MLMESWECFVCGDEYDFEILHGGYLGNYHPLCDKCANEIISDNNSQFYHQLTHHYKKGDLILLMGILFHMSNPN